MVEYVSKKNNKRTSYYKIYNKTGGASVRISKAEFLKKGGSIDIVKQWSGPDDSAPEPLLNGGLYTGESFKGPWGNYPVAPTTNGFMANLASANPPPGALDQFPGYVRLGNNFQVNPSKDFSNETMIKCTGGAKKSKSKKTNKSTKSNKKGGFLQYLLGGVEEIQHNPQTSTQSAPSNQTTAQPTSQVVQTTLVVPTPQVSTQSAPSNQTTAQTTQVVPTPQVAQPTSQVETPQVATPQVAKSQVAKSQVEKSQVANNQVVQNTSSKSQKEEVKKEELPLEQEGGKSKKKSSKPSKKPVNKYKSASYL